MAEIAREDLYEQVWSQPMMKVAAEHGVTGTGLKKICDRHDIPTPERGYWAKLQHGKRVHKAPLPNLNTPQRAIRLPGIVELPDAVRQAKADALARMAQMTPAVTSKPAAALGPAREPAQNPALVATTRAMAKARPDGAGFAAAKGPGLVSLRVAPASVERALSALSRLFDLAETHGYQVKVSDVGLNLSVDDEPVRVELEERARDILHQPTAAELKRKAEQSRWGATRDPWRKYDQAPSGNLAIVIGEDVYKGPRRRYSETKATPLADLAPEILVGVAEHAAFQKDRRQKAQDERRARAEREARRAREEAFAAREKRRMEFVNAIHAELAERAKLALTLSHLEDAAEGEAWRLENMKAFVRRRLAQIEALISARDLGISANFAEIDFDEARAAAKPDADSPYRFYSRAVELQFWLVDEEKDLATSQSPLQWAIDAGHAVGLQPDAPVPSSANGA